MATNFKKWLPPLLIVTFAVFIAYRSSSLETKLNHHIQDELINLLNNKDRTDDEIKKFAINAAIESTLVKTVKLIDENINMPGGDFSIFVKNKKNSTTSVSRGPWTHLAMVEAKSGASIEFMVLCEGVSSQVYVSGINTQGF